MAFHDRQSAGFWMPFVTRRDIVRLVAALGAIVLLQVHPAEAQDGSRVRVLDRGLKGLLEFGSELSPTLRYLLEQLEATSVLVFVDCNPRMPERIGARSNFVASVNGVRYVRVDVDCALVYRQQLSLLAHELQHALEIGGRSDIVDADSMESYYEDIGFQTYDDGKHKEFETFEAIAVQRRVDAETSGKVTRTR
jgi:hypothetical protein